MRTFTELPPLSLYIHIPWCVRKCPYCDFNSHEQKATLPEDAYVEALLNDLTAEMPRIWGRSIASVFIGGGTPSLFSAKALDNLMSGVRALTALQPNVEVTMEANPGTFEQEKFRDFRTLGINRLSIGVQSFNEAHLKTLGRIHSGDEAIRAIDIAHKAGFEDINVDLMFALPQQSETSALNDVKQAIALAPTHISYYELTLEPNTLFAKHPPVVPEDEQRWQIHKHGMAMLAEHGYQRYEISAFAKESKQCKHNNNYWLFGDYLGIGAGAHSKISSANTGDIVRRWKHKHPTRYLSGASGSDAGFVGGETTVSLADTAIEFMMNTLRLKDGFAIPVFEQHTGVSINHWQPAIEQAISEGLLEQSGLHLRASEQGFNFLNDLLDLFMPNDERPGETKPLSYPVIQLKQE